MTPLLAGSVLDPLYSAFGAVLAAYFSVVQSYGFAIALLTVTVRVVLIPLTAKQVRSQQAMTKLQPEMKRIQAKYKNDRQKLNEEMMALYKEHGANPLSGCLPLILQMPLFIVLYRLVHDLSHKVDGRAMPKHLPKDSLLYESLVEAGGRMNSWGMDLAEKAGSVQGGLGKAFPYYFLVALVVATGFYQQRQMMARTPKDSMNPQMQMVMKIFPAMFGFISLQVPAGVVVYFVVSNLWQIGQQAVTFRMNPPAHVSPDAKAPKSDEDDDIKPAKSGKGNAIPARATPSRSNSKRGNAPNKGNTAKTRTRPPSGRAQPKKVQPKGAAPAKKGRFGSTAGRPPPSARPKGLPGRFRGSPGNGRSNGSDAGSDAGKDS